MNLIKAWFSLSPNLYINAQSTVMLDKVEVAVDWR